MRSHPLSRLILRWALLAAAIPVSTAGLGAAGLFDGFSLRVGGGGLFNIGGSYNDTSKLRDIVNLGGGPSVGLRFQINRNFYLTAAYGYTIMSVKSGAAPFAFRHQSSYFNLSAATLDASFYLKSGYPIEPFLTVGGGLYPWAFRSGIFGGKAWPAPANPQSALRDTSPGLSLGLGAEANIFIHLTAFVEFRYTYLFSRNIGKFGSDDFTQTTFLGINVGVIYYFHRD